ncbi:MAG: hypothetical protein M3Q31_05640 [Actinomycetota bacterium]|nr:hypothetical protein [Actinomycetota bacterium]
MAYTHDWSGRPVNITSSQLVRIENRRLALAEIVRTIARPLLVVDSYHRSHASDGMRLVACRDTATAGGACYLRAAIDYSPSSGNYLVGTFTSSTATKPYEHVVWKAI